MRVTNTLASKTANGQSCSHFLSPTKKLLCSKQMCLCCCVTNDTVFSYISHLYLLISQNFSDTSE